jgi:pimeloyl-ACP methyl ester carboxylesterase
MLQSVCMCRAALTSIWAVAVLAASSPALAFESEEVTTAGGYPALVRFVPGEPEQALVVFVPGAHHTARIAYGGHEGSQDEDFLAHWLVEEGYNFLGVSYPIATENPVMKRAHPEFTAQDWGRQTAEIARRIVDEHGLSNRIIVIGWSMGGKIVQPVSEAAEEEGLDLDFYLSFAATPPLTGAITMNADIAMADSGYADRSDLYAGWLGQLADNNADNGGRTIIDERTYLADYVGDMSINLQGYGLRYRDGEFVRDHWADVEDFKSYDFASLPTIAMIMPNEVADGRHALTDQANWGLFLTNKIMHGDIGGSEVDLDALPEERWFALIDLVRAAPERLGVESNGNHFFFVGEAGARETARAVRTLEHRVHAFEAELEDLIGSTH